MNSPKKKTPTRPRTKKPKGKHPGGRPPVTTNKVTAKLVAAFQNGLNITQACLQAGISDDAYYNRMKSDQQFNEEMTKAKEFPSMLSRRVVVASIQKGNAKSATWWLAHKNRDEFSTKQEVKHELPEPDNDEQERLSDIIASHEQSKKPNTTKGQTEPKAD
jgi:hypothetical protein